MWVNRIVIFFLLQAFIYFGLNKVSACTSSDYFDTQSTPIHSKIYFKNYRTTPVRIEYLEPNTSNGEVILFLPGWNYSAVDWKTKTSVVDSALKNGYSVLLVDMGKSVYMDSVYSQARSDYKNYPTRTWLWNEVLSAYNKRGWFIDFGRLNITSKSHVFGLSTGARGAALLFLDHPSAFGKVVLLSGDYDPLLDENDVLLTNSMGKYDRFKSRWNQGSNNIQFRFKNALIVPSDSPNYLDDTMPKVELFISHGRKDKVVPVVHSENLCAIFNQEDQQRAVYLKFTSQLDRKRIKRIDPVKIQVQCWLDPQSGHDYLFWDKASLLAWNSLF